MSSPLVPQLINTFTMTFTFVGFECLLMCLKLFKYGSINKRECMELMHADPRFGPIYAYAC